MEDGRLVAERDRQTEVTRLGDGVDATGRLSPEATDRVMATCARYRERIDALGAERVVAVLTSAVRDAANGAEFRDELRRFGFEADVISGEREARLTYRGATGWRRHDEPLLVLDIGGGSTELVVGAGDDVEFHVSTQIGSVRFTERHLTTTRRRREELAACRRRFAPASRRPCRAGARAPRGRVAVAGTPTSFAAIELRLEPYDRERVHGHRLTRAAASGSSGSSRRCRSRAAAGCRGSTPIARRRSSRAVDPGRDDWRVRPRLDRGSERDILEGAALAAGEGPMQSVNRVKTPKVQERSVKRPL